MNTSKKNRTKIITVEEQLPTTNEITTTLIAGAESVMKCLSQRVVFSIRRESRSLGLFPSEAVYIVQLVHHKTPPAVLLVV